MRSTSPLLLATLLCTTTYAQVDMQDLLQQHLQQSGITIEDDNDPFSPNVFVGSFRMEMQRFENGKRDEAGTMDITFVNSADKTAITTTAPGRKETVRMVRDLRTKTEYMLMDDPDGGKMALKTRMKKVTVTGGYADNAADLQVTDETKVIDGHTCVKVIVKDEGGTWTGWLAKDMEVPFTQMLRSMGKHDQMGAAQLEGVSGFPLEYEWVDATGEEKVICHIRDVKQGDVDEKAFSMEGYQVMEMPSLPMGR